ncbi:MAG: hypothetical protein RAP70_09740 [Candidatus Celaenobacter antarcticus]|nr:hypothetical protein [Candidatus Celaenobacter antarcticus]
MNIKQAYYTSCKVGLRGSPGFQFNAVSPDISHNTMSFLERYGLYEPPVSLSDTAKAGLFPKALSFYVLPDNTFVLSNSEYLCFDYSGRRGNYFTHFIIVDDFNSVFNKITPISMWKSNLWKNKDNEKTELPFINSITAGKLSKITSLSAFISQRKLISYVHIFISSIISALKNKQKRIIIVDSDENIAQWITLISFALPNSIIKTLTFTTYCKNPYNSDLIITGTTSDSDFNFSQSEIQFQYFVFDFENNRFSPEEPSTKFSDTISKWYLSGQFEEVIEFKKFCDNFDYDICISDLDSLIILFKFIKDTQINEQEILSCIDFIIKKQLFKQKEIFNLTTVALIKFPYEEEFADSLAKSLFDSVYSNSDVSNEIKDDVIYFYIDWVVQRILPKASVVEFNECSETLLKLKISSTYWNKSIQKIYPKIEKSTNLQWLTRLIDFCEAMNVLSDLEASIIKLLNNFIIPNIYNLEVQNFLFNLFELKKFEKIDQIVFKLVYDLFQKQELSRIKTMLDRPATYSRIESFAQQKNISLFIALNGIRISMSKNVGLQLVSFFKELNSKGISLASIELDMCFEAIQKNLTAEDSFEISEKYPDLLKNKKFIVLIAHTFLNDAELLSKKHKIEYIFRKIPSELQSKMAECIRILNYKEYFEEVNTVSQNIKKTKQLLSLVPERNKNTKRIIMHESLYKYFYRLEDKDEKLDILQTFASMDEPIFSETFSNFFQRNRKITVVKWVRLFAFLSSFEIENRKHSFLGMYKTDMRKLYSNYSKAAKKKISFEVKKYKVENEFQEWKNQYSVIKRIFKINL